MTCLTFNTAKAPFDDVRLRQAVNYAIDRESVNLIAFEGNNEPAVVLPPVGVVFGSVLPDNPYTYDPEKAKQLLVEAGYPDGLVISSIKTPGGESVKMAQVIQRNLADIGIVCEIETLEIGALFGTLEKGDFDLSMMGSFALKDYFNWDGLFTSKYGPMANPGGYSDSEVDQLFDQGLVESDPAKRQAIYKQIVNIINEDAPYVPLVHVIEHYATHPQLAFDVLIENLTYFDLYWVN